MVWLALALEDGPSGMLGEATMQICDLAEQRPLAGAVSFVQVTCLLTPRFRVGTLEKQMLHKAVFRWSMSEAMPG